MINQRYKGKGAILIFVLWALFLISALVMEISFSSGLERALVRRMGEKLYYYPFSLSLLDAGVYRFIRDGMPPIKEYTMMGWRIGFEDEGSRIDVGRLNEKILSRLLDICGVEIGERRSIIVDSFLDWIDKDSDRRLNGAEDDYYREMSPPYEARDGKMLSVEELLLIRGMDAKLYRCISRFLTIYGGSKGININSASKEELKGLGMSDEEIETIIDARDEGVITKEKLLEIMPDAESRDWFDLIAFSSSKIYKVRIYRKSTNFPNYTFIISISGKKYKILETPW